MRMRYDRKTDQLQMLIHDEKDTTSKKLDEDLTVAYTKGGEIAKISIGNALSIIFDGLGVKMPSERQAPAEESEGAMKV